MNTHETSKSSISRRRFLSAALAAGTALSTHETLLRPARAATRRKSPNEKLNLAVVGLGGQGLYDLHEASTENGVPTANVVAICDVDAAHLDRAVAKYPHLKHAKRFDDFRKVLDLDNLDGIVCGHARFRPRDRRRGRPQTQAACLQRKATHEDDRAS